MLRPPALHVLVVLLAGSLFAGPSSADWERGRTAFEAGDHATAVTELREAVEARPDWWASHLLLGRSLAALERPDEALASFEKALELEPARTDVRLILARTALAADEPRRASDVLEGVDVSGPNRDVALRLRATARLAVGNAAEALDDLRALGGTDPATRELEARAYRALGDLARAIEVDRAVLAAKPGEDARRRLAADLHSLAVASATPMAERRRLCSEAADLAVANLGGEDSIDDVLLAGATTLCAERSGTAVELFEKARTLAPKDDRILPQLAAALNASQHWERTVQLLEGRASTRGLRIALAVGLEGAQRYDDAISIYRELGEAERVAAAEDRRAKAETNRRLRELEERERELEGQMDRMTGDSAR